MKTEQWGQLTDSASGRKLSLGPDGPALAMAARRERKPKSGEAAAPKPKKEAKKKAPKKRRPSKKRPAAAAAAAEGGGEVGVSPRRARRCARLRGLCGKLPCCKSAPEV